MEIRDYLNYDPDTGYFTWTTPRRGIKLSKIAGRKDGNGYITICFNYKHHLAHRLAWYFTYDKWPDNQLDHINKIKDDNRLVNLREATPKENSGNTYKQSPTNKYKGVSWHKRDKRWRAVCADKHLGYFLTEEDAAIAYNTHAKLVFKDFAYLNNVET